MEPDSGRWYGREEKRYPLPDGFVESLDIEGIIGRMHEEEVMRKTENYTIYKREEVK